MSIFFIRRWIANFHCFLCSLVFLSFYLCGHFWIISFYYSCLACLSLWLPFILFWLLDFLFNDRFWLYFRSWLLYFLFLFNYDFLLLFNDWFLLNLLLFLFLDIFDLLHFFFWFRRLGFRFYFRSWWFWFFFLFNKNFLLLFNNWFLLSLLRLLFLNLLCLLDLLFRFHRFRFWLLSLHFRDNFRRYRFLFLHFWCKFLLHPGRRNLWLVVVTINISNHLL